MERLQGEKLIDYADRLIQNRKEYDLDYAEVYEAITGNTLSSDECRKRVRGFSDIIECLKSEGFESITDEELYNKLHEKEVSALKERKKLQSEKVEYNAWIREQARLELFEEKVVDAIRNLPKIDVPEFKYDYKELQSNVRDGMLIFADAHYGTEFEVKDFNGKVINKYSPEVFEKRMWDMMEKAVGNVKKESLKHLHIIDLGDSIDGLLRFSQLRSLRMGVLDSIIAYATFMRDWLNELSKHVSIDYYSSMGNHSDLRLLSSKKGDFPHENVERIAEWFLRETLSENKNINIHQNVNDGYNYFNVVGYDVLTCHGQNEKNLENSLKDYAHMYGLNIDYLLTGHLHSKLEKTVGFGKEIIQAPSICGIDPFAQSIKKGCDAGAKMMILEKSEGSVVEYNIKLK